MTVGGSPLECGLESADSPSHESVRAHDLVMRTTRSMQPSYNHHVIGMQYSCSYGRTSTGKEIPIEYLGDTLVLDYPTQVLEIAVVDRYSTKIDLEVLAVY